MVSEERFVEIAARTVALEDIVETLLSREMKECTEIGQYWSERAERIRSDLEKDSRITQGPVHAILRATLHILDEARELAR